MFLAQKLPLTIEKKLAFTLLQKLLGDAHVPKLEGKNASQTILFTFSKIEAVFFLLRMM